MNTFGVNMETFARGLTDNLEPPMRKHLKNVYATFTLATICASAGGYVHLFSSLLGSGLITFLLTIGSFVMLMCTPYDGKNQMKRLSLLAAFAFFTGVNLGPLLQFAIAVNPTLIMEALLGTSVVFACFSLAAFVAPKGHYLYLGGMLMSALSTLFWLSLMNIFFNSTLIFQANLYIGLLVMCGFIVYDTQSIIEKSRRGDRDYVMHAIELFIDFIAVFKRLLMILTEKEEQNKRRKRN